MSFPTRAFVLATVGLVLLSTSARAADVPDAILAPYLQLQGALASDTLDGVPAAAAALEAAAAKAGVPAAPLAAGARRLATAKNLTAARAAFADLSTSLVTYADKTGATLPAGVHLAYCPMVDKPWIQKGTVIKNPYYGIEMIDCGEIKK
jgi:Cu(I)/Ag(I) efflux system membrane fusion protein